MASTTSSLGRPTAARAPPRPPHPMRKCPPRRPPHAPAPATPRQFKDRDTPKIGEGGPARTAGIDVSIRTVSGCASFITCQTPPVTSRRNSTWRKLRVCCARDASRPMRRSRRSATSSSSHCRAYPRPASRACRPQPAPKSLSLWTHPGPDGCKKLAPGQSAPCWP